MDKTTSKLQEKRKEIRKKNIQTSNKLILCSVDGFARPIGGVDMTCVMDRLDVSVAYKFGRERYTPSVYMHGVGVVKRCGVTSK